MKTMTPIGKHIESVLQVFLIKNMERIMIKETEYKCLDPNCKGVMLEHHPIGSAHWLECDCCGETYRFAEYFEKLEGSQL